MPQAGFKDLGLLVAESLVFRTEVAVLKVCGITNCVAPHRSHRSAKKQCKILYLVERKLNSTKNSFNENLLTGLANKYHSQ